MPTAKLTASLLEKATCPQGKAKIDLIDTEVHGLVAEIRSGGTGTFYARYTDHRGKRRYHRLGRIGSMTLTDARKAVQRVNGQIAMGNDPREEKAHSEPRRRSQRSSMSLSCPTSKAISGTGTPTGR